MRWGVVLHHNHGGPRRRRIVADFQAPANSRKPVVQNSVVVITAALDDANPKNPLRTPDPTSTPHPPGFPAHAPILHKHAHPERPSRGEYRGARSRKTASEFWRPAKNVALSSRRLSRSTKKSQLFSATDTNSPKLILREAPRRWHNPHTTTWEQSNTRIPRLGVFFGRRSWVVPVGGFFIAQDANQYPPDENWYNATDCDLNRLRRWPFEAVSVAPSGNHENMPGWHPGVTNGPAHRLARNAGQRPGRLRQYIQPYLLRS